MATANNVKSKIIGLITTAGLFTGKTYATLTEAINDLASAYKSFLAMINGTDIPSQEGAEFSIPDGVTKVPNYLYYLALQNVSKVTLPDTLKTIGNYSFDGVGQLHDCVFVFNNGLESIGAISIRNSTLCTYNNFPTTLIHIGQQAFIDGGTFPEDINLPNIRTIEKRVFEGSKFLGSNITIGSTIESIGEDAFAFADSPAFTLTINRAEDAIAGAPWGATNATIVWAGEN